MGRGMNKSEYISHIFESELSANAKLVTLAIIRYHNNKNKLCFPSMATLAIDCSMCRNSVLAAVKEAHEGGFFDIKKHRPLRTKYTVNNYVLPIESAPDEQSSERSSEQRNDCSNEQSNDCSNERSPDGQELSITYKNSIKEKDISNDISKKKAPQSRFIPDDMPLPDNISRESWQELCLHRRQLKDPMTELSAQKIINKLAKLPDPTYEINRTIEGGWKGIHPEQQKYNKPADKPKSQAINIADLTAEQKMMMGV